MALHNRKPKGCVECGATDDEDGKRYLEMLGYARPRAARGDNSGSSLVLRESTGRYLCESCALADIHGTNRDQESLI